VRRKEKRIANQSVEWFTMTVVFAVQRKAGAVWDIEVWHGGGKPPPYMGAYLKKEKYYYESL